MSKVLMPLPARDFDPTEAAVTWRVIRDAGHQVFFATPDGQPAKADPLMLSGERLDVWGVACRTVYLKEYRQVRTLRA
jgi:putative intracellular protease/amidase